MIAFLSENLARPRPAVVVAMLASLCIVAAGQALAGDTTPDAVVLETGPPQTLSAEGADTCLGCHNGDDMRVIFQTPHGQGADPNAPMAQLQCESCHGGGGKHSARRSQHRPVKSFGAAAKTPVDEQNAICLDCHRQDVSLAWQGSTHERNDSGCADCHRVHVKTDPAASRTSQSEICFTCHRQQRSDSMKPSAHPLRTDDPVRVAAMVCSDCHDPHATGTAGQFKRNTINELCFSCHAEFRGPMIFDHAPVSEDCSLCHEAHGSIHPALLTRRPPLLCQSCHSRQGHPSLSFSGGNPSVMTLGRSCMNCHTQVHGSNHPSGSNLMR